MKKSTRIVKKLLALFLVVLMSINTFGAVVSDNDGSAFITKAEFDSLKNDFQSQIDQYNTSIDAKIDGAISSYLAGINVSTAESKANLSYVEEGITSVRANDADITWKEGILHYDVDMYQVMASEPYGMEIGLIKMSSKSATSFRDPAIVNLDRTNGYAIWKGLCESTYDVSGMGSDHNVNYYTSGFANDAYVIPYIGFQKRENGSSEDTSGNYMLRFGTSESKTSATNPNRIGSKWENTVINRDTANTKYSNIILTPPSAEFKRFVDYDSFLDFQNDTDATGHTEITDASDWVYSASTQSSMLPINSTFTVHNKNRISADDWAASARRSGRPNSAFWFPFFGFVSEIQNWNELATSKYDNLVGNITEYKNDLTIYQDKNNEKHLMISAGAPIVEAKVEDVIQIDLEFADKTKDYDVWFKWNGWKKNDAIEVDGTVVNRNMITSDKRGDTPYASGTYGSKSIKVTNGVGTVYVKAEERGYLFMKWSFSGNSGAGGGTWMPPKTVNVTSS